MNAASARSEAFLARHDVKGGVVLYDEAAIDRLADALSTSTSYRDAAAMLGVPHYCVDALASAGLVEAVSNKDAALVSGAPLIARASIAGLRVRLHKRSRVLTEGLSLRKAMRRIGDPSDWVIVLQKALAGQIPFQFTKGGRALSDSLIVQSADVTRLVARRSEGPGVRGIDITCQQAAEIIGTTAQFVSAAVQAGFLEGEVGIRSFAIPLEHALKFQERFVLSEEIREVFGAHQKTIAARILRAGFRPAATINRDKVWQRLDIEKYVKDHSDAATLRTYQSLVGGATT